MKGRSKAFVKWVCQLPWFPDNRDKERKSLNVLFFFLGFFVYMQNMFYKTSLASAASPLYHFGANDFPATKSNGTLTKPPDPQQFHTENKMQQGRSCPVKCLCIHQDSDLTESLYLHQDSHNRWWNMKNVYWPHLGQTSDTYTAAAT